MSALPSATIGDRLFAALLGALPTRAISRLAGALADSNIPWLKNTLIRAFLAGYPAIDMSEAAQPDAYAYNSFNAFFTRRLADGTRPAASEHDVLACPVDGTLGAFGDIADGQLFQSKGVAYDLSQLVADATLAERLTGGRYATLYLAPSNYHRVHMPLAAALSAHQYVPGRLFGVNPRCVRAVRRLFTRNERLVCLFETEAGPMALVLIGAFIVGGIHDVAAGQICPPHERAPRARSFDPARHRYARGDEMGHFCLGSSVIALFGPGLVEFDDALRAASAVRLNQRLGRLCR